jgi:NAD-dependent SIR2 family protein deacetylase
MQKKKLVVLSGAGMSAESGLKTFRDSDGLWEGYNIEDVATRKPGEKTQDWSSNSTITGAEMYWMLNLMQGI